MVEGREGSSRMVHARAPVECTIPTSSSIGPADREISLQTLPNQPRRHARSINARGRRCGKRQKTSAAPCSRVLFDDEEEKVVQEGDEELANEDEDVVLVEKEAEEGDLFPRRGGKRRRQDEAQLAEHLLASGGAAGLQPSMRLRLRGPPNICYRRGGKGGLRPAPADYRGARAAGQCRGQFRLVWHRRSSCVQAHARHHWCRGRYQSLSSRPL
mmetsp:Transcript_45562/g.106512  ORF Transcript_45562/g.106512 Transcript_45562/m.106512 type:complete len:214 (-) Transcript_45562:456-1097(-)